MSVYDKGDLVRLKATFRDSVGALADPTTIIITIIQPDGVEQVRTYANNAVKKESLGVFYFDYVCLSRGQVSYRWEGDGVVTAGAIGSFFIQDRV